MGMFKGYTVEEYLKMEKQEKFDFFMNSRSTISRPAAHWFDFSNVKKNMDLYGPDLFTLDWLIGKNDEELRTFFFERPNLLSMIPQLLGIRPTHFEKNLKEEGNILKVQGTTGEYFLNFSNIDTSNFDNYIQFIYDSGLSWVFLNGSSKSIHDYAIGVEAGMDSNARKNRSGHAGEVFLEEFLTKTARRKNFMVKSQTTWKDVKNDYEITLDNRLKNVRFDGSLFDPVNKKAYLFEVNNFGGGGSKLKASGGEFQLRREAFEGTNHEFIYITDGQGWDGDSSHLIDVLSNVVNVFNFQMLENGFLDDFIDL